MKKGIFWCKGINENSPHLITVSVECSLSGECEEHVNFSSKSGKNFNHKKEWSKLDKKVTEGYPYNYYPRGRVEIKNGKINIFLNPEINRDDVLDAILTTFDLKDIKSEKIIVKSDGSNHYQYLMYRDDVSKKQFQIENAEKIVRELCMDAITRKYGKTIPKAVKQRLDEELLKITECDGWFKYWLATKLAEKSSELGYVNFVRGNAGGSFVAYILGITETNPLSAEESSGQGHNIPYEFFLGSGKEVYFEIDVANEFSDKRLEYAKEIFGDYQVFYSGIVSSDSADNSQKIIKHPHGKIVIVPKNQKIDCYVDEKKEILYDDQNRFEEIMLIGNNTISKLKKLQDYTGVNVKEIREDRGDFDELSIWASKNFDSMTYARLGENEIFNEVQPKSFSELVKVFGLIHSTGVWYENGEILYSEGIPLDDIIAHREEVMLKLLEYGISREEAYEIAEYVRMGKPYHKGFTEEHIKLLKESNVPDWYVSSMSKIRYLWPKAHAVEFVRNYLREAWFKDHYPEEFRRAQN